MCPHARRGAHVLRAMRGPFVRPWPQHGTPKDPTRTLSWPVSFADDNVTVTPNCHRRTNHVNLGYDVLPHTLLTARNTRAVLSAERCFQRARSSRLACNLCTPAVTSCEAVIGSRPPRHAFSGTLHAEGAMDIHTTLLTPRPSHVRLGAHRHRGAHPTPVKERRTRRLRRWSSLAAAARDLCAAKSACCLLRGAAQTPLTAAFVPSPVHHTTNASSPSRVMAPGSRWDRTVAATSPSLRQRRPQSPSR